MKGSVPRNYRDGSHAAKHLVHGEWMTIYEACERLGVPYGTINNYRYTHRRADGGMGLLVDAWDYYIAVKRGEIKRHPGKKPRRYWVNGKEVTMREAAALAGTTLHSLRMYIRYHRCPVQTAVRVYKKRAEDRAVREIMGIIMR